MACKKLNEKLAALAAERSRLLENKRNGIFVSPALKKVKEVEDALLSGDEELARKIVEDYKKDFTKLTDKEIKALNKKKYTSDGDKITVISGYKDLEGNSVLEVETGTGKFEVSEEALKRDPDRLKSNATRVADYTPNDAGEFKKLSVMPNNFFEIQVDTGNLLLRHMAGVGATSIWKTIGSPVKAVHKNVKKSFPLYSEMVDTINNTWTDNQFVQEMKGWTNIASEKFNRSALNNFLTQTLLATGAKKSAR